MSRTVDHSELKTILDQSGPEGSVLIDVRTVAEYEQGHIQGAVLVPLVQLESIRTMYGVDQALIVYCRSGARSLTAAQKLTEWGYKDVRSLEGGILRWTHQLVPGTPRELAGEEARSLPALLLLALKREAEATMTYAELSVKARSAAQKRILVRLADAEREHLDRLYPWYVRACAADGLEPESLDTIVSDVSALEPGVPGDVLSLLEAALAREYRAWDFYQAAAHAADQDQLRQALHDLAFQERAHAVSVEQMISQEVLKVGSRSTDHGANSHSSFA